MSKVQIQEMLDQILRSRDLYSVADLEFIESDLVIYIRRKTGCRSVLIDISGDVDLDAILKHLESVPAFY